MCKSTLLTSSRTPLQCFKGIDDINFCSTFFQVCIKYFISKIEKTHEDCCSLVIGFAELCSSVFPQVHSSHRRDIQMKCEIV